MNKKRPEITAVNHYNVFPFDHGGSLGIRGLYKALSEWFDVNIVTFVTQDVHPDVLAISPHVKVFTLVLPEKLARMQYEMYEAYGMGKDTLTDSSPAVVKWYHRFPELVERVREIAEHSEIVLAEHVFTWRIVKAACPDRHLWYRANNVEYDYKRTTWDKIGCPQDLLQDTYEIEKECCVECGRVLTVSQLEADRFMELYNLPEEMREKFMDIRSGYDTDHLETVMPGQRGKAFGKYGSTGFFITSYTPYGQTAAENCIAIAEECPDVQIIIAGRIGRVFQDTVLPENVVFTGVISDEEKKYYLQHCDFALNLLEDGAGINVKMFEYFAYGIPVITTAYGARGIQVTAGKDCIVAEKGHYTEAVRSFCGMSLEERNRMAGNALRLLMDHYSWRSLGRRVAEEMGRLCGIRIEEYSLPLEEIALYEFAETESYLPSKAFYIRCAGEYGRNCLAFLRSKGLEPKAFVDEDREKQEGGVEGVPVISMAQFVEERKDEEVVVAVCARMLDIAAQLAAQGVSEEELSLSWSVGGTRIMRLSDLKGCRPRYYDAAKWRREIRKRR